MSGLMRVRAMTTKELMDLLPILGFKSTMDSDLRIEQESILNWSFRWLDAAKPALAQTPA